MGKRTNEGEGSKGILIVLTEDPNVERELQEVVSGMVVSLKCFQDPENWVTEVGYWARTSNGAKPILFIDGEIDDQGVDRVHHIRLLHPNVKIIFATLQSTRFQEIEVRREGVYFYLQKPIDVSVLKKVVTKAVEHESARHPSV